MVEIADAVYELERWERGVALMLQGVGGSFCAGADLSLAREHLVTSGDGRLLSKFMTNTLDRISRCAFKRQWFNETLDCFTSNKMATHRHSYTLKYTRGAMHRGCGTWKSDRRHSVVHPQHAC